MRVFARYWHGEISRLEAEQLILKDDNAEDGDFILRVRSTWPSLHCSRLGVYRRLHGMVRLAARRIPHPRTDPPPPTHTHQIKVSTLSSRKNAVNFGVHGTVFCFLVSYVLAAPCMLGHSAIPDAVARYSYGRIVQPRLCASDRTKIHTVVAVRYRPRRETQTKMLSRFTAAGSLNTTSSSL